MQARIQAEEKEAAAEAARDAHMKAEVKAKDAAAAARFGPSWMSVAETERQAAAEAARIYAEKPEFVIEIVSASGNVILPKTTVKVDTTVRQLRTLMQEAGVDLQDKN